MREILFRSKAINREPGREYRTSYKNGDWVYGLITEPYNAKYGFSAEMRNENGVTGIDVDHITIGQYTGIDDNNGKKIFEGDICNFSQFDNKGDEKQIRCSVVYHSGSFWLSSIKDDRMFPFAYLPIPETAIEIIGNIYDNPELLEEK